MMLVKATKSLYLRGSHANNKHHWLGSSDLILFACNPESIGPNRSQISSFRFSGHTSGVATLKHPRLPAMPKIGQFWLILWHSLHSNFSGLSTNNSWLCRQCRSALAVFIAFSWVKVSSNGWIFLFKSITLELRFANRSLFRETLPQNGAFFTIFVRFFAFGNDQNGNIWCSISGSRSYLKMTKSNRCFVWNIQRPPNLQLQITTLAVIFEKCVISIYLLLLNCIF